MKMFASYLANYGLVHLNCIAMLMFTAIFVGAFFWAYRKSGKEFYRYMESLPLQGD